MKSKKILILGAFLVITVSVLWFFSGIFGDFGGDTGREVIGLVADDGTFLDLDGNEIDDEQRRLDAIREEEEAMANPIGLNVTANEIDELAASLNLSELFEVRLRFYAEDTVGEIEIALNSMNPLADAALMAEFERIATPILRKVELDYSREVIEGIMRTVPETEVVIDFVQYTDEIQLLFAQNQNESVFVVAAASQ